MFFVHRYTARLSRLLYVTMIHFAYIAARLIFESFPFNVQLKLYLLSCTDPHSFVRDRGAFEESIAWQNGSQSGVWSWPDLPSHNFVSHGNNLFQCTGGSGRGDNTFLITLTCRVFLLFRGRGGGDASAFHTRLVSPIVSPRRIFRFSRTFSMGWGVGRDLFYSPAACWTREEFIFF